MKKEALEAVILKNDGDDLHGYGLQGSSGHSYIKQEDFEAYSAKALAKEQKLASALAGLIVRFQQDKLDREEKAFFQYWEKQKVFSHQDIQKMWLKKSFIGVQNVIP